MVITAASESLRYAATVRIFEILDELHAHEEAPNSFRVRFWEIPSVGFAENLTEYRLLDVDGVQTVLSWVSENAGGRRAEIFLEWSQRFTTPQGTENATTLIRLTAALARESTDATVIEFLPKE